MFDQGDPRPTAFFFLRAGNLVRNFANADMIEKLRESGYQFVIFSPNVDHPLIHKFFAAPCFRFEKLNTEEFRPRLPRLHQFFVLVRRITYGNTLFSEAGCRHANLRTIRERDFGKASKLGKLFLETVVLVAGLASRFSFIRRALQIGENYLAPFDGHGPLYQELKPSITVTLSFGYREDALIFREARSYGSKPVVLVKNWDIATTKGYCGEVADYALVWNEMMASEAIRFQDTPADGVRVCGIPQWDYYFKHTSLSSRDKFCARYSLDPARKIIYFATTTPMFYRHNLKVARMVLSAMRDGKISEPAQLLIRLHPAYILFDGILDEETKSEMDLLVDEFGELLSFSYPETQNHSNFRVPNQKNDTTVQELLVHSDVMLTVYSTQMVEAMFFDLPVVNAGIHEFGDTELPISHYDQWEHIRQINNPAGISYCYNNEDVFGSLNEALSSPAKGSEERKNLADRMFPPALRGQSGALVAEQLIELTAAHTDTKS
ncbi:MAG: hypothetical protein GKS01_05760 [Alphaproteobacteria bacterium]|nr:hypothetical protein [Alphaproteobacteria bacterium]